MAERTGSAASAPIPGLRSRRGVPYGGALPLLVHQRPSDRASPIDDLDMWRWRGVALKR